MNNRNEEFNFILNVLINLKTYSEHNVDVLDAEIARIKFLIERS